MFEAENCTFDSFKQFKQDYEFSKNESSKDDDTNSFFKNCLIGIVGIGFICLFKNFNSDTKSITIKGDGRITHIYLR